MLSCDILYSRRGTKRVLPSRTDSHKGGVGAGPTGKTKTFTLPKLKKRGLKK